MSRTWIDQTPTLTGQAVQINGWVHRIRRMGDKLVFVDLRDGSGLVQLVFYKPGLDDATNTLVDELRPEFVICVSGTVNARNEKQFNLDLLTGKIEVGVLTLTILNRAKTPPFEIDKDTSHIEEKIRLQYRYLDLRTERLQRNMRLRNAYVQGCRRFLLDQRFVEIETPYLTQATPEGSRDFIVPSRLQPGKFFALPQSPQQYKQLLMTAGFDRYFQLARCFRDEDPRADRGFEHTQIDVEMSFVERDEVMAMIEAMVTHVIESLGYTLKEKPFPRFTYQEAMKTYGADKFDLRTEEDKANGILAYAWVVDFPFFEKDEKTGKWTFTHNPFSNPKPEFIADHLAHNNVKNILTTQYDLVCNGSEVGGGSIRAHDPAVLRATYEIMGYTQEEIEHSVGHMLHAFQFGTPPHGGIGMGVERTLMNMTGEQYLREVQAFPMTGSGNVSVMNAPSEIDPNTLRDLGIQVKKP